MIRNQATSPKNVRRMHKNISIEGGFGHVSVRWILFNFMIYDIFNCSWVATRWQLFSTHVHTNNTGNVTKQTIHTIHRTTQKYIEQHNNQEQCGPSPVFAGFTLAFALQLRKNHGKTSVRVVIHKHKMRIHSHNNKNT